MAIQNETKERIKSRIREPKRYQVIMHNDDYTPMEFVVEILIDIFHKKEEEANALMLMVHKGGRAAVGTYSYDIACSKLRSALDRAQEQGYPFRMTLEEV